MIRTEEEAEKIFCPIMPRPLDGSACRCLASLCMAWRWATKPSGETYYEVNPIEGQPGMYEHAPMGYCGLAGTPKEAPNV